MAADWLEKRRAAVRAVRRPEVDDQVERGWRLRVGDVGFRVGIIEGVVLAVVDDERAQGGWAAMIRWWDPSRERWLWEVHDAADFLPSGGEMGCRLRTDDAATSEPVEAPLDA